VTSPGFTTPPPRGPITRADLRRLISRIQVLQLDSVSAAVRAHYAPVFSRFGPYDHDILDRAAWGHDTRAPRLLVEYWAHEAALMAVDDWPLLRWRMRQYRHGTAGQDTCESPGQLASAPDYAADLLTTARSPLSVACAPSAGRRSAVESTGPVDA
jgi:uncharacterized protein YcaQ